MKHVCSKSIETEAVFTKIKMKYEFQCLLSLPTVVFSLSVHFLLPCSSGYEIQV